jgi:hypothetical protein
MIIPNATFASSFTSKLYAAAVHKDIYSVLIILSLQKLAEEKKRISVMDTQ